MPEISLWTLVIAFAVVALGATLKAVEYNRLFNKADKDVTDLRAELAALKKKHEETIASMNELHSNKVAELTAKIDRVSQQRKAETFTPTPIKNHWMG